MKSPAPSHPTGWSIERPTAESVEAAWSWAKFQKQSWVPKWCLSLHLSWALGSLKLEINGLCVFFHVIHPNFYSFHKIIIVCSLPKWVFMWILIGIVIWLHGIYLVRYWSNACCAPQPKCLGQIVRYFWQKKQFECNCRRKWEQITQQNATLGQWHNEQETNIQKTKRTTDMCDNMNMFDYI